MSLKNKRHEDIANHFNKVYLLKGAQFQRFWHKVIGGEEDSVQTFRHDKEVKFPVFQHAMIL